MKRKPQRLVQPAISGHIPSKRKKAVGSARPAKLGQNFWRTALLMLMLAPVVLGAAQLRPLDFQDVMAFRAIHDPIISNDGKWVAYQTKPDRGDGEVVIQEVDGTRHFVIALGAHPAFSDDSRWLAARTDEPLAERLSRKEGERAPEAGMVLVDLQTGQQESFHNIRSFAFAQGSTHVALLRVPEPAEAGDQKTGQSKQPKPPNVLMLRTLPQGTREFEGVESYAFDPSASHLAFIEGSREGAPGGAFLIDLSQASAEPSPLRSEANEEYAELSWSKHSSRLGFLSTRAKDKQEIARDSRLWCWQEGRGLRPVEVAAALREGWFLPFKNRLSWSDDASRLFFGVKPESEVSDLEDPAGSAEKAETPVDPSDIDQILSKREVDVWHWRDDYINPQQKLSWNATRDRTYLALYDPSSEKVVQLADEALISVRPSQASAHLLGFDDRAYRIRITWDENYRDVYLVDPRTGSRKEILKEYVGNELSVSPEGRFLVYYQDGAWHLYDSRAGKRSNLTEGLPVPFADEDHDYPSHVPGYGIAGWFEDESAVLIYDKYDIWQFSTAGGQARNLTGGEGRRSSRIFRVHNLDPDRKTFRSGQDLLLTVYDDLDKSYGFARLQLGEIGPRLLLAADKRFQVLAKARDVDRILYTRESYQEFPDLRVGNLDFSESKKVSDVNPQIKDFLWGESELVSWDGLDGRWHQGVLIKPGNYEPGKRYPVLVYYYRFFSQRLHEFNQPVINHRPCFPLYTSNGYAIFLPDIRFEIGRPGFAATKSLVPGVQKLIDIGIADPDAIGLHGHSWSGYQTAFIITQTNLFAAAVAGAPVSNMTSSYGGIRWSSGRARQFQYERTQSRLGVSLWENPMPYIENSPLFYADRINTPLLIEFGDEDGAVPWYQGIELYLAMRRLGKDCVFLEYRGEPHHLEKYPNKLDYAIKMKEYFDHYLRGFPAAKWITEGVPYRGK